MMPGELRWTLTSSGELARRLGLQVTHDVAPLRVAQGRGDAPDVDGAEQAGHPHGDGRGVRGGDLVAPVAAVAEQGPPADVDVEPLGHVDVEVAAERQHGQ